MSHELLLPLLFLLFTAVPAWLGAGLGYAAASATGEDPRPAAAGTAFRATGCGVLLGCFAVSVLLAVLASGGRSGSGIMEPGVAWVLLTFVLGIVGIAAGAASGAMAALGAWLGAGTSRRAAQWMAAILAVAGAFLAPYLLKFAGAAG